MNTKRHLQRFYLWADFRTPSLFTAVVLGMSLAAGAQAAGVEQDGVRVEFSPPVTEAAAHTVLADEVAARNKVATLLGHAPPKLIVVRIDDSHDGIPYSDDNVISVPEKRIDWPRTTKDGRPRDNLSLIHETTHVIDSGTLGNRFLTEGLAVYVEDKLGAVAYPNIGVDLHTCTRELQTAYGKAVPIVDSEKVREAAESGVGRQLAYTQEGSYVRWLIESHGLADFQRVLDSEPPEKVYGKSFEALEGEWRAALAKQTSQGPSCMLS